MRREAGKKNFNLPGIDDCCCSPDCWLKVEGAVEGLPREEGELALTGEAADVDCPSLKSDIVKGAAAGAEVVDELAGDCALGVNELTE